MLTLEPPVFKKSEACPRRGYKTEIKNADLTQEDLKELLVEAGLDHSGNAEGPYNRYASWLEESYPMLTPGRGTVEETVTFGFDAKELRSNGQVATMLEAAELIKKAQDAFGLTIRVSNPESSVEYYIKYFNPKRATLGTYKKGAFKVIYAGTFEKAFKKALKIAN